MSTVDVRPPGLDESELDPTAPSVRPRSPGLLRSTLADRRAWIALPPLLLVLAMAVVPAWFDGAGPRPCDLRSGLEGPSLTHPFGIDLQGCDLWARSVHGTRNSALVGFGSVVAAGLVATVLGTLAGMSRVADAFVVKYDAAKGQTHLAKHRDGSVLSFNIALNERFEYEGGGTWFEGLGTALPIERGHVCCHASGVLHGGHPITAGVRYILVAFVIVEGYQNWAMRYMKAVWGY